MSIAPEEGNARSTSTAPAQAGLVLVALILVAAVANLNLAVANVALPDIGAAFGSSQTTLNLIAVGYSLGLACSVLYLGALGDRYGRKAMLVIGTTLAIPMSVLAAWAPTDVVLFIARLGGGLAAGMAFPTTLALITALWSGPGRTKSIALWSGLGGAISALGPLLSGLLLEHFWWGSVFLLTLPLAVVASFLASRNVPAHVNEATDRSITSAGSFRWCWSRLSCSGSTSRRSRTREPSSWGWRRSRSPEGSRSSSANAVPATRCMTSTSPAGACSGSLPARASSCSAR